MTSREKILGNIQTALKSSGSQKIIKPDFSQNPYLHTEELMEVIFAENFKKHKGDFFYCENLETFLLSLETLVQSKNLNELWVSEDYPQQLLQFAQIKYQDTSPFPTQLQASLSLCELLVARTGSVLVSSHQKSLPALSTQASTHIILAFTSQLVHHLHQALEIILHKYANNLPSQLSLITGPSITQVFDKSWMCGAQGPEELVLFLVDDIIEDDPNTNP